MKLRILSDLHLEFAPYEIKYFGEDILILAGDISTDRNQVINLIKNYLSQNDKVIVLFILGNHDYYFEEIWDTVAFYYKQLNIPRVHLLQDDDVVINGIRFFGATLWTDLKDADESFIEYAITDYRVIKNFDAYFSKSLHDISKTSLKKTLDSSKEPVVVITHHLPSFKSINLKYKGYPTNPSFASNLDDLVGKCKLYVHGHTHTSLDYVLNGTRVVCNPRGYVKKGRTENEKFQEYFVIEI
jgi:Icc-related predicted phosphoesterase